MISTHTVQLIKKSGGFLKTKLIICLAKRFFLLKTKLNLAVKNYFEICTWVPSSWQRPSESMTNPVSQVQRPEDTYNFTITNYKKDHFIAEKLLIYIHTLTWLKVLLCKAHNKTMKHNKKNKERRYSERNSPRQSR